MRRTNKIYIVSPSGSEKEINSLDWSQRYSKQVPIRCIELRQENGTYDCEAIMRVFYEDKTCFIAEFKKRDDMYSWVNRRLSWEGVKVHHVLYGQSYLTVSHKPDVKRPSLYGIK